MNHEAIYTLYPQVVTINGEEAFDSQGNQINIDSVLINNWINPNEYKVKRLREYPSITDYLDGIVKGDQAQIDKYIADCQAVKAKYPKE